MIFGLLGYVCVNVNICAMVKVVAFLLGMVIDLPPLMERNP